MQLYRFLIRVLINHPDFSLVIMPLVELLTLCAASRSGSHSSRLGKEGSKFITGRLWICSSFAWTGNVSSCIYLPTCPSGLNSRSSKLFIHFQLFFMWTCELWSFVSCSLQIKSLRCCPKSILSLCKLQNFRVPLLAVILAKLNTLLIVQTILPLFSPSSFQYLMQEWWIAYIHRELCEGPPVTDNVCGL